MPKNLRAHAQRQSLGIAVGLALCMAIGGNVRAAEAQEPLPGDVPAVEPAPAPDAILTYWRQHREGWFWYRDPLPSKPRPPSTTPKKSQDLNDFQALQQRLDDLKRVAVMNPTDTNLLAYMRMQRMVMDKSQVFADRWQRLVWREPDLDYGMTGRQTGLVVFFESLGVELIPHRPSERRTRASASSPGIVCTKPWRTS